MPLLWPETRAPQFFSTLGVPYAVRSGLLRIADRSISVRCENSENCGVNFWTQQKAGTVEASYSLEGAGALYAIATDGTREIEEIPRLGVQLTQGANRVASVGFQFIDERVQAVVLALRLNEGLSQATQIGTLVVNRVNLTAEVLPAAIPPQAPAWVVLVPVTRGEPEVLIRTYRFVVRDRGAAADAVQISAGSSVDSAIENQVENVVFNRINHTEMFELRISRTAFDWNNTRPVQEFLHKGRRYEVMEIV